jgi:uncharacterized protein YukE
MYVSHEHAMSSVVSIGPSEADSILQNLRVLREQIVVAWAERAVVLSREEQDLLHLEVKETCEFLSHLTRSHTRR